MSDPPKDLGDLFEDLLAIKRVSERIHQQNFTRKKYGKAYPIPTGYSTQVRRPVSDILRWMYGIEELLDDILERLSVE